MAGYPAPETVAEDPPRLPTVAWALRRVNELHFQVTSACNLACRYCYAGALAGRPSAGELLDIAVFRAGVDAVLAASRAPAISIIFHGGEPLLQPPEFFAAACAHAAARADGNGKTVTFGLQSNLTLLSDAHVDILREYGVSLGTSLDGPADIHNRMRGGHAATMRGVAKARAAGIFSGPICVIGEHNYHRMPEVMAFMRDNGMSTFLANVGASVGRGASLRPLPPEAIFDAFRDIFATAPALGFAVVEKRMAQKIERHLRRRHGSDTQQLTCDTPFCHAGVTMVAVDLAGDVYPCGCAGSGAAFAPFRLGRVADVAEPFAREPLQRFHAKTAKYAVDCHCCRARFLCEHGCPAFDRQDPAFSAHVCTANVLLHDHLAGAGEALDAWRQFLATGAA